MTDSWWQMPSLAVISTRCRGSWRTARQP